MRDIFDEYGWTLITVVGGMLGLYILFHLSWGSDSQLAGVMNNFLNAVMK